MSAITTALSGLEASVAQLTASASNVANVDTVGSWGPAVNVGAAGASGPPLKAYQPVQTVQTTTPDGGVAASQVPVTPATTPAYDPTSPAANAQGLVAAPNVDLNQEVVGQIGALAAYQANLAVIKTSDRMTKSLLAIA
jgi:flagellar basal-body rod protein FlgC